MTIDSLRMFLPVVAMKIQMKIKEKQKQKEKDCLES